MNDCRKTRTALRTVLENGGAGRREDPMNKHIDDCPECRRMEEDVRKILNGAESVREDLRDVMDGIDWDSLPNRIADAAFAQKKPAPVPSPARSFWRALFRPPLTPVLATLLVGIILGAAGTLLVLKPRPLRQAAGSRYFLSPDLIDRAELQLARRETLDYLDKSQYLLLDFVQSEPGKARLFARESGSLRLQDVLSKKRYIDPHLDSVQMSKAREICNQIEILLLELSQLSDGLSAREEAEIKDFIEQRQLLLKIKLLKKELLESEV